MDDLRALANYAANLYRRKVRELDGWPEPRPISANDKRRLALIRQAVLTREFIMALDLLGQDIGFGDQHILFLRKAFPFLSDEERAGYLTCAWQPMKGCGRQRLAIQLFREAAPGFKSTIPQSWPAAITVYRGAQAISKDSTPGEKRWRWLTRQVRKGFSWTINRESALWFAGQDPERKDQHLPSGDWIIGCLASATVSSQDVIAYFGAPEGDETAFAYDEEDECIIDPQRIGRVTYEDITAPITTDAEP